MPAISGSYASISFEYVGKMCYQTCNGASTDLTGIARPFFSIYLSIGNERSGEQPTSFVL